jgi:hypothetical protein
MNINGSAPIGAGARGAPMEPAETLRKDNQAAHTRESRQPVSQPPCRLNKTQQSSLATGEVDGHVSGARGEGKCEARTHTYADMWR